MQVPPEQACMRRARCPPGVAIQVLTMQDALDGIDIAWVVKCEPPSELQADAVH